jgi:hypothetical protein
VLDARHPADVGVERYRLEIAGPQSRATCAQRLSSRAAPGPEAVDDRGVRDEEGLQRKRSGVLGAVRGTLSGGALYGRREGRSLAQAPDEQHVGERHAPAHGRDLYRESEAL